VQPGRRPSHPARWLNLLIRLANRVYFTVRPHLARRELTRDARVRLLYGPSRRLLVAVGLLWMAALAALSHLVVLVLHRSLC
jgi:hypothetical protein